MAYRFGLIAKDIQNSVTPVVYDGFMKDLGLEHSFRIYNIPEEELADALAFARNNLDGFNVTMPYKQRALAYMDELDESAVKCGSTNTVLVRGGKLIGFNTDGWGLVRALSDRGVFITGRHVVMLGAGGVASSIAYNLYVNKAARVDIVNIDLEQAQGLCKKYDQRFAAHSLSEQTLEACCAGADLFINASVMGQVGYDEFQSFAFLDGLQPGAAVFDVNYSNPVAKLVPTARAKGIPAWKGRAMTACQGIRAVSIWTGLEPSQQAVDRLIAQLETM